MRLARRLRTHGVLHKLALRAGPVLLDELTLRLLLGDALLELVARAVRGSHLRLRRALRRSAGFFHCHRPRLKEQSESLLQRGCRSARRLALFLRRAQRVAQIRQLQRRAFDHDAKGGVLDGGNRCALDFCRRRGGNSDRLPVLLRRRRERQERQRTDDAGRHRGAELLDERRLALLSRRRLSTHRIEMFTRRIELCVKAISSNMSGGASQNVSKIA